MSSNETELSEAQLRAFLTFGSLLLDGHKFDKRYDPRKRPRELAIMQHFVTLLCRGEARVVAVTGVVTPSSVEAILISRSVGSGEGDSTAFSLKRWDPSPDEVDTILTNWANRPLKNFVSDLVAITSSPLSGDQLQLFHYYALRYCAGHIFHRSILGSTIWRVPEYSNPFTALAAYVQGRGKFVEPFSWPMKLPEDILWSPFKCLVPSDRVIQDGSVSFQITALKDVVSWVGRIGGTVELIIKILGQKDDNSKPRRKENPSVKEIKDIFMPLSWIHWILESKLLDLLLQDPVVDGWLAGKRDYKARRNIGRDSFFLRNNGATDDDEDGNDNFADSEKPHHGLIRWLSSITAGLPAVNRLASYRFTVPLRAHELKIPHPDLTSSLPIHRDKFLTEFPGHRDVLETELSAAFSDLPGQLAYHAEAIIMCLVAGHEQTEPLPPVFEEILRPALRAGSSGQLAIGVQKKCCWFCWSLSELLNESNVDVRFSLMSSHDTVYPWCLPPVTLPLPILRRFWDDVKERIMLACDNRKIPPRPPQSLTPSAGVVKRVPGIREELIKNASEWAAAVDRGRSLENK